MMYPPQLHGEPMPSDWDWNGPDEKKSTVVRQVDAVAVYTNLSGDLVIRQQSPMGEDDSVIVVPMEQGRSIMEALKRELQEN